MNVKTTVEMNIKDDCEGAKRAFEKFQSTNMAPSFEDEIVVFLAWCDSVIKGDIVLK
jgi:hypothetical protein